MTIALEFSFGDYVLFGADTRSVTYHNGVWAERNHSKKIQVPPFGLDWRRIDSNAESGQDRPGIRALGRKSKIVDVVRRAREGEGASPWAPDPHVAASLNTTCWLLSYAERNTHAEHSGGSPWSAAPVRFKLVLEEALSQVGTL